jgi:hypothetical protein
MKRFAVAIALPALLVLAAPLMAQRYPHASTVMPANYLAAMPPASRVMADMAVTDSTETRARRLAAIMLLQRVIDVLTDDHMFDPGLTREENELRLGYLNQDNLLSAGSGLVPGLTPLIDSYCCGEREQAFRREVFNRYFPPEWQAAYLRLERTVEQRENARSTAMNPPQPDESQPDEPQPDEPAIPATGWARIWPRDLQSETVVEFAAVSSRLIARVVSHGLIESRDGGLTWATTHELMNDHYGYPLAVMGEDVWATSQGGVVRAGDASAGRPVKKGATMVTALAAVNGKLFAASEQHGLLISRDRGASWRQPTMMGDPERGATVPEISAMAANGPTLFVAAEGHGIYRTSDDGVTWIPMNADPEERVFALAASDSQVYAVTQLGVFVATRTGTAWSPFSEENAGLTHADGFTRETVRRITVDEAGNAFASTQGGQVFVRARQSGEWRPASAGLPRESAAMETFDRPLFVFGPYLYLGNERGIWRRRLAEMLTAGAAPAR